MGKGNGEATPHVEVLFARITVQAEELIEAADILLSACKSDDRIMKVEWESDGKE